jgi:hypothetical protein
MNGHRRRLALGIVLVAVLAAACGGSGPTATPSMTPAPSPPAAASPTPPAPTDVPGSGGVTPAPPPDTFRTAWGAAWDTLPPGYPVPADAQPAEPGDPADGPVSGAFVVQRAPAAVVEDVQAGLAVAGYSTEALSGPSEDGALVVDSVGLDPACRVQTTVRPLGGLTMITVLFGAACAWG